MAIADGALSPPRSSRVRHIKEAAKAMAARVEDELRVSASRANIPMALLLFLFAQLGGCVAPLATGVWWMSRLSFRVEILEKGRQEDLATFGELRRLIDGVRDGRDLQVLRDKLRDLERDAISDRKDFDILETYTRGRIDHLPWRNPPARR